MAEGVTIKTDFGSIKFNLLPDLAPETVRNFSKLAKSGFYNGTLFPMSIGFLCLGTIAILLILSDRNPVTASVS